MSHPINDRYLEAGVDLSLVDESEAVDLLNVVESGSATEDEMQAYCKVRKILKANKGA